MVQRDAADQLHLLAMEVAEHNLGHVNTTGFKQCRLELQTQITSCAKITIKNGECKAPADFTFPSVRMITDFTQGQLCQTGDRLDVAIQGEGFLQVELPNGSFAYTRDGSLKLAPDGRVVTSQGYPLMSGFQPVPKGTTFLTIDSNGKVTCGSPDGTLEFLVCLYRFARQQNLKTKDQCVFAETPESGAAEMGKPGEKGFGQLLQGFLECSNVRPHEQWGNMLRLHRARLAYSTAVGTANKRGNRIER